MTRHPYDAEPTPARDYDAVHAHQDAMRDLPVARVHVVPPLAAYDIHARLVEAIRKQDAWTRESRCMAALNYEKGLREAYRIVFGKDAP